MKKIFLLLIIIFTSSCSITDSDGYKIFYFGDLTEDTILIQCKDGVWVNNYNQIVFEGIFKYPVVITNNNQHSVIVRYTRFHEKSKYLELSANSSVEFILN